MTARKSRDAYPLAAREYHRYAVTGVVKIKGRYIPGIGSFSCPLLIISPATRTLSSSSSGVMNRNADSRSETGLVRMYPSAAGVWYLV
jgi:hypothetical protein